MTIKLNKKKVMTRGWWERNSHDTRQEDKIHKNDSKTKPKKKKNDHDKELVGKGR